VETWVPRAGMQVTGFPNGGDVHLSGAASPGDGSKLRATVGPIIMMVGRFDPQKDQGTLIRALGRLDRAHLVLVGEGATRAEAERLAARLGLAERTHFLGEREDIEGLLKLADIYVQSS